MQKKQRVSCGRRYTQESGMADNGPCGKGVIPNESNPGRSGWFGVTVLGNTVSWQEVASARTWSSWLRRIQRKDAGGHKCRRSLMFLFCIRPKTLVLGIFSTTVKVGPLTSVNLTTIIPHRQAHPGPCLDDTQYWLWPFPILLLVIRELWSLAFLKFKSKSWGEQLCSCHDELCTSKATRLHFIKWLSEMQPWNIT